jgi:hypothetical protein
MKVLELCHQANATTREDAPPNAPRKGVFTSGIVSVAEDHRIALFFTGHCHAGENLVELLKRRQAERQRPIQSVLSASVHDMHFRGWYFMRRQEYGIMRTTYYEDPIKIECTGPVTPRPGAL